MTLIRKPPQDILRALGGNHLFLAGSIEMGLAENWQSRVEKDLADWPHITNLDKCKDGIYKIQICNPRTDWETGYIDEYDYKLVPFKEEDNNANAK